MIRFLRSWLVPLLALLMLICIAVSFVPLTNQAESRVESELTLIMDRAFARIGESARQADPVIAAEEKNLLDKAHAVARFLEHDDALLASDALIALCEQLSIDRIDVANIDGTIIASSDATRMNLQLSTEETFAWAMPAANDATAALTQADKTSPSMLYACVGRSDIEGFVLLTRDDPFVADALEKSGVEAQIADLPYGGDVLFIAQTGGEDGFFRDSGNLCLRRTADGVTLIAARSTAEVFAIRNAALLALGVAMTCVVVCGIADYLLRLEPVSSLEEDNAALNAAEEPAGLLTDNNDAYEPEAEHETRRARRKRLKKEATQENETESIEPDELSEQHEQALENAPRQAGRNARKKRHAAPEPEDQSSGEEPFDKIVE